jgi:hypothetical protein
MKMDVDIVRVSEAAKIFNGATYPPMLFVLFQWCRKNGTIK